MFAIYSPHYGSTQPIKVSDKPVFLSWSFEGEVVNIYPGICAVQAAPANFSHPDVRFVDGEFEPLSHNFDLEDAVFAIGGQHDVTSLTVFCAKEGRKAALKAKDARLALLKKELEAEEARR